MTGLLAAVRLVIANSRVPDPGELCHESINSVPLIGRSSKRKGKGCPVVVLHGVTPEGENDPRMIRFLGGLAAAGVDAYAPRLEGMASGVVKESDVLDIARVVEGLSVKHGSKVGVVGFSVGGGYGLLAAARGEIQEKLAFVCSVGGYARLREMVQGFFEAFGDDGEDEGWARIVCFHSFSSEKRLSPGDRDVITRMARLPCGGSRIQELESLAGKLEDDGKKYFDALLRSEAWVRDIVLNDLDGTGADKLLSPVDSLAAVDCPVFLLHGLNDPTISWEQSAALKEVFVNNGKAPANYLISRSFGHVQPGNIFHVWSLLMDLLFFGSFLKRALKEC